MSNTIETAYDTLEARLSEKEYTPSWFIRTVKSLINKTITIDEYNTLTQYLKNVVSDSNSIAAFLEAIKTELENISENAITGAVMNGQPLEIINKILQIPATYLTAGYGISISDQGVISVNLEDADEEEF